MQVIRYFAILSTFLPLTFAQQFTFTGRNHTYHVTVTSRSSSGLGFAGHWLYEPSVLLPSALTNNKYVLLFNSNTQAFARSWPTGEAIYMQTSTDGLNWGSPVSILSRASNICDMADARPIYDTSASVWRVFVQAVTYSGSTCGTDNQIFEATGPSLSRLSWYGTGGNATSLTGDLGNPGVGQSLQWFNTANYHGPSNFPILTFYNNWNFNTPDYNYCPGCAGNGTDMLAYFLSGTQQSLTSAYYTPVASAPKYQQGSYFLIYPDFLLGGSADELTLGPPGFGLDGDCSNGNQIGRGLGFYATPVPGNSSQPGSPGQFVDGTYSSSLSGLIVSVKAARNPYGFLDKISSSPNTWQTYIYYNAADELNGTKCPDPAIQDTFKNAGFSGSPSAKWGVSQVTITEE